jgi:hypothetical protein
MDGQIEQLLAEIAKPVDRIQRSEVLRTISSLDASNVDKAPMIFFLLESLFYFVRQPGCTISLKELMLAVLGNATLTPILYQVGLTPTGSDKELDQMIAFVQSFQRPE